MTFNRWSMTRMAILMAGVTLLAGGGCQSLPQGVSQDAVMVGLADSGKLVRLEPGQQQRHLHLKLLSCSDLLQI